MSELVLQQRYYPAVFTARIIDAIFGIIEGFLALRMLLELFGANPGSPFVAWVYGISASLIGPFAGAFAPLALGSGYTIDIVALLASTQSHIFSTFVANIINWDIMLTQFNGCGGLVTYQFRFEFIQQFGKPNKPRTKLLWILIRFYEFDQFLCCIYHVSYHVSSKLNVCDANCEPRLG